MRQTTFVPWRSAFCLLLILCAGVARADFHLWQVHSVFSNADGSVQYVQLHNTASGETALNGRQLQVRDSAGVLRGTFVFERNLNQETANRFLLLATPGFAALPGGIEPDFEIPAGFLPTRGGSVNFAGVSTLQYQAGQLPKNGRQAFSQGGLVPAAPRNLAQQQASINAASIAYFDPATLKVRLPVVVVDGTLYDVDLDLVNSAPIELRLADFHPYTAAIETGDDAAVFSAGVLTVPAVRVGLDVFGRQLDLVNAGNFTFGNLREIVQPPIPQPPAEPEPPADPALEESIERGRLLYGQQCALCHCSTGAGFCSAGAPPVVGGSFTAADVLSDYIAGQMPFGSPQDCIGQCADDVANYIIERL